MEDLVLMNLLAAAISASPVPPLPIILFALGEFIHSDKTIDLSINHGEHQGSSQEEAEPSQEEV
jgi:hypothetical protein